jgi:hypothetical protein
VKRRPIHILTAVSLLVCVAGWVLSYWRLAGVAICPRTNVRIVIAVDQGSIGFGFLRRTGVHGPRIENWIYEKPGDIAKELHTHFGFGFLHRPMDAVSVAFPIWLCMILIGCAWYWLLPRMESPAGFCVKCGYDLRATPERCTECGTIAGYAKAE